MRSIAVFIDGTTNDHTDLNITNVLKMHRLTAPSATSLYFRGLGNEFDNESLLGRLFGGAFGAGADAKRDEAYAALSAAHQESDRIYILGFSRGAAIARMLAAKVHGYGLNGLQVSVTMLGCFDTVASFGLPGNDWNLFKDFHVAPNVVNARHAVALHEQRPMFPPTLMNQRVGIREVWFRGDHSDVGGGNALSGLSDEAMRWMMVEADELGLPFRSRAWFDLNIDHGQEPHRSDSIFGPAPRVPGVLVDDEFREGGEERHVYSGGPVRPA